MSINLHSDMWFKLLFSISSLRKQKQSVKKKFRDFDNEDKNYKQDSMRNIIKIYICSPQDSKFPTYARMASFMESQKPKVFTSSNADGVDRVLESPGKERNINFMTLLPPYLAIPAGPAGSEMILWGKK